MIFRACQTIAPETWEALPSTTSALESIHADYYQTFEKNLSLVDGTVCLLKLAELNETEHIARSKGQTTRCVKGL